MDTQSLIPMAHPAGELVSSSPETLAAMAIDTPGGRIHARWDSQAPVTPLGQAIFFIEFLKTANLYEPWVEDCPLSYESNHAPSKKDVLGTLFLSILAGHHRYAHVTAIRADQVLPGLLSMSKVVSEDSLRRAFCDADPPLCAAWMHKHLKAGYEPLLYEPWVLDVDTTVKTLFGHQSGAVVGYNPHKPGRPSHAYHTYIMARTRLVLDVEVQSGDRSHSKHTMEGLWAYLESLPREAWPTLMRGDCDWGTERQMSAAEAHDLPYLFKIRQTSNVRRLIERTFDRRDWADAGQGWEGAQDTLRLSGWTRSRPVAVLRRELQGDLTLACEAPPGQMVFAFVETVDPVKRYEYAVLVTPQPLAIATVAQLYRDRADAENVLDELKNQWGWCGYTTHDLTRCQVTARAVALIYNWWSLFARLAVPDRHAEAITSRPLLLHAIGRQTHHGGQTIVALTSLHGKGEAVRRALTSINACLRDLRANAEQWTAPELWRRLLSRIFAPLLDGRLLRPPPLLENPTGL